MSTKMAFCLFVFSFLPAPALAEEYIPDVFQTIAQIRETQPLPESVHFSQEGDRLTWSGQLGGSVYEINSAEHAFYNGGYRFIPLQASKTVGLWYQVSNYGVSWRLSFNLSSKDQIDESRSYKFPVGRLESKILLAKHPLHSLVAVAFNGEIFIIDCERDRFHEVARLPQRSKMKIVFGAPNTIAVYDGYNLRLIDYTKNQVLKKIPNVSAFDYSTDGTIVVSDRNEVTLYTAAMEEGKRFQVPYSIRDLALDRFGLVVVAGQTQLSLIQTTPLHFGQSVSARRYPRSEIFEIGASPDRRRLYVLKKKTEENPFYVEILTLPSDDLSNWIGGQDKMRVLVDSQTFIEHLLSKPIYSSRPLVFYEGINETLYALNSLALKEYLNRIEVFDSSLREKVSGAFQSIPEVKSAGDLPTHPFVVKEALNSYLIVLDMILKVDFEDRPIALQFQQDLRKSISQLKGLRWKEVSSVVQEVLVKIEWRELFFEKYESHPEIGPWVAVLDTYLEYFYAF